MSDWIQDILYLTHGYFHSYKTKHLSKGVRVSLPLEGLPLANKIYSYTIPFMDEKRLLYFYASKTDLCVTLSAQRRIFFHYYFINFNYPLLYVKVLMF